MAGKFLTPEEAARQLGVTIEELNRLVDRKELFPIRDGASSKFKTEEIERVARDMTAGDASGTSSSGLGLDLDLDARGLELSGAGLELSGASLSSPGLDAGPPSGVNLLAPTADDDDHDSIFAAEGGEAGSPSQTVVRGGAGGGSVAFGSGTLDIEDLDIASLSLQSAPALGKSSDIDVAKSAGDSLPGISGISSPSLAGGAVSGISDAGLSLETEAGGVSGLGGISGLDLDAGGTAIGSQVDALAGSLAGDAFDLGGGGLNDDESASVVIATEDTGDSSFFGAAAGDDSASVSFDDSIAGGELAPGGDMEIAAGPKAPPFSVWQVVGLVCSSLVLMLAGLIVFDVVRTIRAPIGEPVSSPILTALADTFGW